MRGGRLTFKLVIISKASVIIEDLFGEYVSPEFSFHPDEKRHCALFISYIPKEPLKLFYSYKKKTVLSSYIIKMHYYRNFKLQFPPKRRYGSARALARLSLSIFIFVCSTSPSYADPIPLRTSRDFQSFARARAPYK